MLLLTAIEYSIMCTYPMFVAYPLPSDRQLGFLQFHYKQSCNQPPCICPPLRDLQEDIFGLHAQERECQIMGLSQLLSRQLHQLHTLHQQCMRLVHPTSLLTLAIIQIPIFCQSNEQIVTLCYCLDFHFIITNESEHLIRCLLGFRFLLCKLSVLSFDYVCFGSLSLSNWFDGVSQRFQKLILCQLQTQPTPFKGSYFLNVVLQKEIFTFNVIQSIIFLAF